MGADAIECWYRIWTARSSPTSAATRFLRELFAQHGRVLTERWGSPFAPGARPVEHLNELVGRGYSPRPGPPARRLGGAGTAIRGGRRRLAGGRLTAAEIAAMPWGTPWTPQRKAVEHDTNVRAASPYAVLSPGERLAMLADLAALP